METELCLSLDAENRSEYENFEDEEEIKLFLNETKRRNKCSEIEKFLETDFTEDPDYLNKLRSFSLSEGGLVNDKIRKQVWPKLLGIRPENLEPYPSEIEFESHVEFSQVVLDVNRSIKRFPPGIPYNQRLAMQDQLIRLILRVIMKHPQLQYYQGYHDVAITFLLVVGENMAFHIMEKLSTVHLKHFMEATMEKTAELLDYIFPLMEHVHPELCSYIEKGEVGSMFCLPWFLTWYSHTLNKYENVVRLYDYFLASEPLIPLYLVPVIVIYRQDAIFAVECEMSSLHQELSQLPDNLPFDRLLKEARDLYNKYPPQDIEKEAIMRRVKLKALQEEQINRKNYSNKTTNRSPSRRNWTFMQRIVPDWFFPYGRLGLLIFSASFIVGLYAYYRYANNCDGFNQ